MSVVRDRVALVTGAARGLGFAIAQRLGSDGHPVVLVDSSPSVDERAGALRESGIDAKSVRLDVADEVAATVGFLVTEGASYLTGASLDVNGGSFRA